MNKIFVALLFFFSIWTNAHSVYLSSLSVSSVNITDGAITSSKILDGAILNSDINASAGITYGKLNLTGGILNADLAGSIAASKLIGSDIATVGTITSGTWSGTTIAVGKGGTGTTTTMTTGSVLFSGASGVYSQDNSNLFWDDTNNRLGIGTATPASLLHVKNGSGSAEIRLDATAAGLTNIIWQKDGAAKWQMYVPAGSNDLRLYDATLSDRFTFASGGALGIGTTLPATALHVNGVIRIASPGSASGTALVRDANGDIKELTSSERFKSNISALVEDTSKIYDLAVVNFTYIATANIENENEPEFVTQNIAGVDTLVPNPNRTREVHNSTEQHVGIIAEDTYDVTPLLVNMDVSGLPYSIDQNRLFYYMLRQIQVLNARITALEAP